jgi:hypothetical protein
MSNHQEALPRFIKPRQVQQMLGGISRGTLRDLVNDGVLQPPVELSCRLKLYNLADVLAAVQKRTRKA